MRIRDIEVDDDIAAEIDRLLVQMSEDEIQAARAYFKANTAEGAARILEQIGIRNARGQRFSAAGVKGLLKSDRAQALLTLLRKAISRHTIRDAVWAEHQYAKVHERCMQVEPVTGPDGEVTGEYKFDAGNALRAIDGIVKLKGLGAADKQATKDADTLATLSAMLHRIDQGAKAPGED